MLIELGKARGADLEEKIDFFFFSILSLKFQGYIQDLDHGREGS